MRRTERGNTLVELLAATVIIGIISYALTESLVSGLNNSGDSQERVSGSVDRQRVAAAFVPDAQSTQTMDDSTGDACGEGDTLIKNLRWSDLDPGGPKAVVATYWQTGAELVRWLCVGGDDREDQMLADIPDGTTPAIVPADVSAPENGRLALRVCPDEECRGPGFQVIATRRVVAG